MSNKMTRKMVASEYLKLRSKRDYETHCAALGEGVIRREDKGGELVIYKSRAFWCKDGYATVFLGKIPRHVSDIWVQKPFDREKDGYGNDIIVMTIEDWEAEGESVYHYIVNPDYNWEDHRVIEDKGELIGVIDNLVKVKEGLQKELDDVKSQLKVLRKDRTLKTESNTDWKERYEEHRKVAERTILEREQQIRELRTKYQDAETNFRTFQDHVWRIAPHLFNLGGGYDS